MSKRKVNRLTDITVEKVGLVSLGANQETFFLLKSVDEELNMSDTEQKVDVDTIVDKISNDENLLQKIASKLGLKKLVAEGEPEAEGLELEPEPEAEQPEPEVEAEAEEPELELGPEAELEPEVEEPELEPEGGELEKIGKKFEDLEKANRELSERLENAEKVLLEKQAAIERQGFLSKAAQFRCVPVAQDVLADNLYKLSKTDDSIFEFFVSTLSAMDKALGDAGLFAETGTSESFTTDSDELIKKAVEAGNSEEIKKLMLELDPEQAEKLIESRRARTKSRVR